MYAHVGVYVCMCGGIFTWVCMCVGRYVHMGVYVWGYAHTGTSVHGHMFVYVYGSQCCSEGDNHFNFFFFLASLISLEPLK